MTSSCKEGWTLACCTSEHHQSAVTWTAQQTASGGDSNVCHPLCGQRSCSVCPCLWRIRPAILHVWAHSLQIARALHSCRLLSERTTEWYVFCFIFSPPKLFVMPFLSNLFPYDNQMSETWSLRYNQSQRTCHYPYCKPTYSLNVKKIADDKCGLIRNTCLGGVLMGRVWVLADEKHRICSLRCELISFRKRIKKWKKNHAFIYIYIYKNSI